MKRAVGIATAMVLVAWPALGQPVQQFDLRCTKRVTGSGVRETNARHYRLDLAAKRWCIDECDVARDIQAVSADKITINETDPADRQRKASHVIYRGSGKYMQTYENRALGTFILTEGECVPAPFSGLPAPKF